MTKLQEKMKTMTGYCSSCGVLIMDVTKRKRKPLPNYCEHTVELSNKTIMTVGVCSDCKTDLASGNASLVAKRILDHHKIYWKNRSPVSKHAKYDKMKVTDPSTNYLKFRMKRTI